MATLTELLDAMSATGASMKARGEQFEVACKWLLEHHGLYGARFERVWHWNDWPQRWGSDTGIDLVAQEGDGRLWAVQAKVYDRRYAIKKADIDSFVSAAARPVFSARLLVATTDRLGTNAMATLHGVGAATLLRNELELLAIDWPSELETCRPMLREPKTPRRAALRALDAAIDGFGRHDRGQLIMACGSGKTLIGMWTSERLASASTLVMLPSLSLLSQTLREWSENSAAPLDVLAVCSDETVSSDSFVRHTSELPVPVTTEAVRVADFLRTPGDRPKVVFATYQSSAVVASGCAEASHRFCLLIADEAHRCAGRRAGVFAVALDDELLPARRRLFMTATPRVFTARVRGEATAADLDVTSMDDAELFGPVFHRLTFGQAIDQKLLSNYRVVIVGIDDDQLAADVQRRRLLLMEGSEAEEIVDAASLAAQVAVVNTMRRYDLVRLVSFHNRVDAARRFSQRLPAVQTWLEDGGPKLSAGYVSGAMPTGTRTAALQRLRNATGDAPFVLSNARCLAEGVDIPNLDGVAFVDPRSSQIEIVQAVGRAIRSAQGKTVGTIVLPVLLRDTGDDGLLDESVFAPVWRVLRALRAHDETLTEELDEIRRSLGRLGGGALRKPDRIVLDLPDRITASAFEAMTLRVIEESTNAWDYGLGRLQRFIERERHSQPLFAHIEDSFPLGKWVSDQRKHYVAGELRKERADLLGNLPGWAWVPRDEAWQRNFDALAGYLAEHGRVPSQSERPGGLALGHWARMQRKLRRENRLAPAAEAGLDDLVNLGWTWSAHADGLGARIAALRAYSDREGNLNVPSKHVEDGVAVGEWLGRQRRAFRRGLMASGRLRVLDEEVPGWRDGLAERSRSPRPTSLAAWWARFELLRAYVDAGNSAVVPQKLTVGGVNLGAWVAMQRVAYNRDGLHDDQVTALSALDGWSWNPAEDRWRAHFAALQRYSSDTGRAQPRAGEVVTYDPGLYTWVFKQRRLRGQGKLEPWQVQDLESIDVWDWHGERPQRSRPTGESFGRRRSRDADRREGG